MDFTLILAFVSATILLALLPGPDNVFVLTESLTSGRKQGIAISLGLSLGVLVHTTASALGISIILQQSTTAFNIIKFVGAAYLLYLAYLAWQDQDEIAIEGDLKAPTPFWNQVRVGFFMNVLNPKVAIFFIAFLPQFVTQDGWPYIMQMIALGILFMILAFIVMSSIAIVASSLRQVLDHHSFWKVTRWVKVVVLIGLAVMLLVAKN